MLFSVFLSHRHKCGGPQDGMMGIQQAKTVQHQQWKTMCLLCGKQYPNLNKMLFCEEISCSGWEKFKLTLTATDGIRRLCCFLIFVVIIIFSSSQVESHPPWGWWFCSCCSNIRCCYYWCCAACSSGLEAPSGTARMIRRECAWTGSNHQCCALNYSHQKTREQAECLYS